MDEVCDSEEGKLMFYRIKLSYACYGVRVSDNGIVYYAPPVAKWMIGKHIHIVKQWVAGKGGTCETM